VHTVEIKCIIVGRNVDQNFCAKLQCVFFT